MPSPGSPRAGRTVLLGHEVDPGIGAPSVWPFVPQPHPPQLPAVDGAVRQEPLADVLELLAPAVLVGIERFQKRGHRAHEAERRTPARGRS